MSAEISAMITQLKFEYLDARKVGIRRFAQMTNIKRTRLVQLFAGTTEVTPVELSRIKVALDDIEQQFKQAEAKNPQPVPFGGENYLADPRLLHF